MKWYERWCAAAEKDSAAARAIGMQCCGESWGGNMTVEMHKCRDCERQIPTNIPCCIYCKSTYRTAGICWWCGVHPMKPQQKRKPQSQYCEMCQSQHKGIQAAFTNTYEKTLSYRASEQRGRKAYSAQQAAHMPDDTE